VAEPSKTQIDRLGARLRETVPTESDLTLLDDYRRSFAEAYEFVVRTIRDRLELEPTGRSAKSTKSVIEKLRRESVRLSQVQDIAGCRVIVEDIAEQDLVVESLIHDFAVATVQDRRVSPSHGYRAVHVIVELAGKLVEIQIRTSLQQRWAEMSEKLADIWGAEIKYGGGHPGVRDVLTQASELVLDYESGSHEADMGIKHRLMLSETFRAILSDLNDSEDESS
jgi:ppGpp synthetase/RelA/SpoT-type nucleotidyltranferase